jgi:hypothetical protein
VVFYNGKSALGTAPLNAGVATLNVSLTSGTHFVGATYVGDANYESSKAVALKQVVTK